MFQLYVRGEQVRLVRTWTTYVYLSRRWTIQPRSAQDGMNREIFATQLQKYSVLIVVGTGKFKNMREEMWRP